MTHHLSPLSGCRLPGEARPSEWARGQEEVLADPVGGGVLSQPQHRPPGPEGGESAAGWTHEHQDCRYCTNVVQQDASINLWMKIQDVCLELFSFDPLPAVISVPVIQKCLNYLPRPFAQCWEVVRGCLWDSCWLKDATADIFKISAKI